MKFARRAQKSAEAKDPFLQTYVSFGLGAAQKMGLNLFQAEHSFGDSLALADADGPGLRLAPEDPGARHHTGGGRPADQK